MKNEKHINPTFLLFFLKSLTRLTVSGGSISEKDAIRKILHIKDLREINKRTKLDTQYTIFLSCWKSHTFFATCYLFLTYHIF